MAAHLFEIELFNLKFPQSYYNNNFEEKTGLTMNRLTTSNKKTQIQIIKNILEIYDIHFKILTQMIVYCNNKAHINNFKEYHVFIRMMRIADGLFNNNFNLNGNLNIFDKALSNILNNNYKSSKHKRLNNFKKNRKKLIYLLEQSSNKNTNKINTNRLNKLNELYFKIHNEYVNTKLTYDQTGDLINTFSTLHVNSNVKLPISQFKNSIFYYAICLNYYNINKIYNIISEFIHNLNDVPNNSNVKNIPFDASYKRFKI